MSESLEYQKRINAAIALRDIPDHSAALVQLQKAVYLNPLDSEGLLLLGQTYQDMGKAEDAERNFRHALEVEPNSKGVREALLSLLIEQVRISDATEVYRPLADPDTSDSKIILAIANRIGKSGKPKEAFKVLELCMANKPDMVILKGLINMLKEEKEIDRAINLLTRILEGTTAQEIVFDQVWVLLADVYNDNGEIERFDDIINKGLIKHPSSIILLERKFLSQCHKKRDLAEITPIYEKLLALTKALGEAEYKLAKENLKLFIYNFVYIDMLLREKLYERAIATIDKEIKDVTIRGELSDTTTIWLLERIASRLIEYQRLEDALTFIKKYKKTLSGSSYVKLYYEIISRLDEPDKALPELKKYIRKTKDTSIYNFLTDLGIQFTLEGLSSQAWQIYNQLSELDNSNPVPFYYMGLNLLEEFGCEEDAEEFLKDLRFIPEDIQLCEEGYLYIRLKQYDLAFTTLKKATEKIIEKGGQNQHLVHIAYIMDEKIDWAQGQGISLADLRISRRISAKIAIQANLAAAYHLIGKPHEAIKACEKAIEYDQSDCAGYRAMGCLHFARGNHDLALIAWKKALEATHSEREAEITERWIDKIQTQSPNELK